MMNEKIKIMLIKRKMTLKELGEKLGTSSNNISNKLKRDNFSEQELKEIAEALNCKLEIFFLTNDTNEKI